MKKKALVTGGTKKDTAALAVFVINIKETNPTLVDEIVIFHDGILKKDQKKINSVFPCRFELYQFPGYDPNYFSETVNFYFSPMVFCKYECFRLLNDYQTVIWSDYDVVIIKDISELTEPCKENIKMMFTSPAIVRDAFIDKINEIDFKYDMNKLAICLPIFVLYDSLNNYYKYYEWCIKKTKELGQYLYLPEQAIVNLLLQEFNISIYDIYLEKIYATHPRDDKISDKTKILHAYGQQKFWNGISNDIWNENYKKWLRIGGSEIDFNIKRKNLKKVLKKILLNFIPFNYLLIFTRRVKKNFLKNYDQYKRDHKIYKFKYKIIKYLKRLTKGQNDKEIINFLKYNELDTFPYNFSKKYDSKNIIVYTDNESSLKYVLHDNKRLYFRKDWNEDKIKIYYNSLLIEQDTNSPHRYEYKNFMVSNDDVVIDAGVAEGNFALSIVEKVQKLYLFEADQDWIPILKETFKPWEDKVFIINKYVSNIQDEYSICLDDYFNKNRINFIKADVEGAELKLLEGGRKLISEQKQLKIVICTYHKQNDAEEINNELLEYGFHTEFSKGYMIYESWIEGKKPEFYVRKGLVRGMKIET